MPRPPTDPSDEQKKLIAEAVVAARQWKADAEAAGKSERYMWESIERARTGGAQANHLVEALKGLVSRATFFRRFKDAE